MSAPAEVIGTMALGSLLPSTVPRSWLYLLALVGFALLFRKQIRRMLR